MKIRRATKKDIQRIAELGIEYGNYEHNLDKSQKVGSLTEEKKIATKFFKNKEVEWFVLVEDNIVGFVSVSIDIRGNTKIGVFHTIFIEEPFRGKGIGKKLLKYAFEYLKSKGCSSVRSHVFPKNKRSLKLYRKLGFHVEKNTGYTIRKELK